MCVRERQFGFVVISLFASKSFHLFYAVSPSINDPILVMPYNAVIRVGERGKSGNLVCPIQGVYLRLTVDNKTLHTVCHL